MAGAVAFDTERFCGERPGLPRVSRRRRSCGFPPRKFAHGGKGEGALVAIQYRGVEPVECDLRYS